MINLDRIIRKNISQLVAYSSARSLTDQGSVFLDANEAPDSLAGTKFNRYPQPQPSDLRQALATFYGVKPQNINMGRGADEAIDLLVRMSCEPNRDKILIAPPTYGMYQVSANIQGAGIVAVPMQLTDDNFRLDTAQLCSTIKSDNIKLCFICRPNNPTGEIVSLDEVEALAEAAGSSALVVVDEAYLEFADSQSATWLIDRWPNIVVLRTFSKAWALAGARFGVAIADERIIKILEKVRAPYPLSQPVIDIITDQLSDNGLSALQTRVQNMVSARDTLNREFSKFTSVECVYPSAANFLLVKTKNAASLFTYMKERGIVLRDRSSQPLLSGCIRVTVGSTEENQQLLECWRAWEQTNA